MDLRNLDFIILVLIVEMLYFREDKVLSGLL